MALMSPSFIPLVSDLASSSGVTPARVSRAALTCVALECVERRLGGAISRREKAAFKEEGKKRYVVAPLLYQQASAPSVRDSLRLIGSTLSDSVIKSAQEGGSKVLSLTPLEAAVLKERFSALLIEEDIQFKLPRTPLVGEVDQIALPQGAGGNRLRLTVSDEGTGAPVAGVKLQLYVDVAKKRAYEATTNARGAVTIQTRKSHTQFERILALPHAGYWSRIWENVPNASPVELKLTPLPVKGFDWGHETTEAGARKTFRGEGIKIAVIDSGVRRHPSLKVVGGKNFIMGEDESAWDKDDEEHGTHCAGVIAALERVASVWGYVPRASIYAFRVFGGEDGGGFSSDIADAIALAVKKGCDIISMSFVTPEPSSHVRREIERATDAGVLCVAAAGNDGGAVAYPAKYKNVLAVSAIGKLGAYPKDSHHRMAESPVRSQAGDFYLASFSNRGEEVDFCAPGVAITSTVPPDAFSAWDGTSMACPHVAGIAGLALQSAPKILEAARDSERMGRLYDRLLGIAADLGMGQIYQGSGLPLVSRLVRT